MPNVLFICGKARMRSPTAAEMLARYDGFSTDFAGLSNDADERVSSEHIEWADVVAVMERRQRNRLTGLFAAELRGKRLVVLDVPDKFAFMQQELVDVLDTKFSVYFTL